MKFKHLFLLFLFFSAWTWAESYDGSLLPTETHQGKLAVGDTFRAELQVHPAFDITELTPEFFKGKTLWNVFYVVGVESIAHSENNQDVLTIGLTLAVKGALSNPGPYPLDLGKHTYHVSLDKVGRIQDPTKPANDFQILEQRLPLSNSSIALIILMVLLFIALGWGLWKRQQRIRYLRLRQKRERDLQEKREHWRLCFQNAHDRTEFEHIYLTREEWGMISGGGISPSMRYFFSLVERIQYHRDWNEKELTEVSLAFDAIRDTFKNNGL